MIDARLFLDELRERNAGLFTGVPCSLLKPFINHTILATDLRYVCAVTEGEAVGIAVGSTLAGRTGVVLLQNSGLGNTVNPITSLTNIYRIPCLLIVSHRGDPEGRKDAAQHAVMGRITGDMLDLIDVYRQDFPGGEGDVAVAVERAFAHMKENALPAAFVLKRDVVEPFEPDFPAEEIRGERGKTVANDEKPRVVMKRSDAVAAIADLLDRSDLVVSATGKTSRELAACHDRPGNFYMQGSMGTTAAIGLGVALVRPERRMVILDGDGAVLMRMGSLATVGHYQPEGFVHVLLDNGAYDSTGGQQTVSPSVHFPGVAVAAGYRRAATVYSASQLREFWKLFAGEPGPSLLHVKVLKGAKKDLPRPAWTPVDIRDRFMESLNG